MDGVRLIEGRKHAPERLGRVLILGLGKSGMAATRYCADLLGNRVESLHVAGGKATDASLAFAREFEGRGVSFAFDNEEICGEYDLCIVSPGISDRSDFYQNALAHSADLIVELEFAWRESAADSRWIAVTGTNGKTTTTTLIEHILKASGVDAFALGNIGDVALEVVTKHPAQVYVAEVSSYQLASTKLFAADAAVLLGITPDHISWHGSMERYAEAKFKLLGNLASIPGSFAVMDATNDIIRAKVRELKALPAGKHGFGYIPIGTAAGVEESMVERCGAECAAYAGDGRLLADVQGVHHDFGAVSELNIKGRHNVINALAAACAALAAGVADGDIATALASFKPLEHRIEMCGSIQGVFCCNDSKATNVDATLCALTAFEQGRAIVLLGGCDKGTALEELVGACKESARAVVCFGAAGPRFYQAFAQDPQLGDFPVLSAGKLQDALDAALGIAKAGDTVLLSPACSSFDEFTCFEERGARFKAMVAEYAKSRGC